MLVENGKSRGNLHPHSEAKNLSILMNCFPSFKSAVVAASFSLAAIGAFSQGTCSEIFMSEVLEGSGNNKGIEFFNPTDAPIDLSAYRIQRWANGFFGVSDETQLTGVIPALGTWVLVNGQTEDVPLGGGSVSPLVDPIMQGYADQLDNPYPAPTYANGNDAFVLVKDGPNGEVIVDVFGKPGEDPGGAWTDDEENGFTDVGDGATWLTRDQTLRRKFNVTAGVTTIPLVFNALLEWDTLAINTWDGLGQHSCECGTTVVREQGDFRLEVFPNPTSREMFIQSSYGLGVVRVFNMNGEETQVEHCGNEKSLKLDSSNWPSGMYVIQVENGAKSAFAHRIVVQ